MLCAEIWQRKKVEHLSTALTLNDREAVLDRVKTRLADKLDSDWAFIATSCVEAGVDFSFRTGFRELGSLSSLLQAAGRINREGVDSDAELWTFCIAEDGMLKPNPGLKRAGIVLKGYFEDRKPISPQLDETSRNQLISYVQALCERAKSYGGFTQFCIPTAGSP